MRAGLGVRDGAPSPHAGRAAPPFPWGPGALDPAGPGVASGLDRGRSQGLARTLTLLPRGEGPPAPPPPPPRVVAPSSAPGRGPQSHPFPGVGGRVTARRANGEEARRGREVGGASPSWAGSPCSPPGDELRGFSACRRCF